MWDTYSLGYDPFHFSSSPNNNTVPVADLDRVPRNVLRPPPPAKKSFTGSSPEAKTTLNHPLKEDEQSIIP